MRKTEVSSRRSVKGYEKMPLTSGLMRDTGATGVIARLAAAWPARAAGGHYSALLCLQSLATKETEEGPRADLDQIK